MALFSKKKEEPTEQHAFEQPEPNQQHWQPEQPMQEQQYQYDPNRVKMLLEQELQNMKKRLDDIGAEVQQLEEQKQQYIQNVESRQNALKNEYQQINTGLQQYDALRSPAPLDQPNLNL